MKPVDLVEIEVPGAEPVRSRVYDLNKRSAGAGDEWMYELRDMQGGGGDYERAFEMLCCGDLLGAQLLLRMAGEGAARDGPHSARLRALCEWFAEDEEGKAAFPVPYVRRSRSPWQCWGGERGFA